jgi:serine/threonine protein kinase
MEPDSSPPVDTHSTPQPQAFSSISRLFSQSSVLDKVAQGSRAYAGLSFLDEYAAFSDPIIVLGNLMDTLRENGIPGPQLLRLKTEFDNPLGHGAQSEVFGFNHSILTAHGADAGDPRLPKEIRKLTTIAIKRSRVLNSRKRGSATETSLSSEEFVFLCTAAHREIDVLCHKAFHKHPNIVSLVGWGLCLDSLEDSNDEMPRIPLLLLERAFCSFADFLADPTTYAAVQSDDLCDLLLDVGHGLEAIHEQGIAHGDLKPDNILIFKKSGEWCAKLCDFGLSTSDAFCVNGIAEYRGTPGWRPPEFYRQSWAPLDSRGHQRCDIFAFGLVVWSTFKTRGRAPRHPDMENIGTTIDQATCDLMTLGLSSQHYERVILTIQSALAEEPQARQGRPWKYLDSTVYKRVGKRVRLWRQLVKKTRRFRYAAREFRHSSVGLSNLSSTPATRQQSSIPWCRPWMGRESEMDSSLQPAKLIASPERYAQLFDLFQSLSLSMRGSAGPEGFTMIKHSHQPCMPLHHLRLVHDGLLECIKSRNEVRLYALARLRSRLPMCCWRQMVQPVHFIEFYMQGPHAFVTLAWLCRGEIGAWELNNPDYAESIMRSILKSPQNFSYFAIRRDQLTTQQRSRYFLLFLEHGIRIEHIGEPSGATIFLRFLHLSNQFAQSGYGDLSISDICINFKRIAQKQCIQSSTRFYMTGALPNREESTTGYWTTALHDSVIAGNYTAVEILVRSGFVVNALNGENKTALYLALQQQRDQEKQRLSHPGQQQSESTELYRIIALLRQNSAYGLRMTALAFEGKDMPMGWEQRSLFPTSSSKPIIIYHDILSHSLTFRQPTFSLYEDRRLALGSRRFSASGQTYYLDLLRFISPANVNNIAEQLVSDIETYDDSWFQREPTIAGVDVSSQPRVLLTQRDLASVRRKRQQIHRGKYSLLWVLDLLKVS